MKASNNSNGWKDKANKVKRWVIQHKTELIVGTVVVTTVVISIVVWNNKEAIIESIHKNRSALKFKTHKASTDVTPIPKASIVSQTMQVDMPVSVLDSVDETTRTVCEHPRREHIRILSGGRKASPAKITEAAEKGIPLNDGETLVNSCIAGSKCA